MSILSHSSAATIGLCCLAKLAPHRWPRWWTAPLMLAPTLLIALVLTLHASDDEYIGGTHWLMRLLGPPRSPSPCLSTRSAR